MSKKNIPNDLKLSIENAVQKVRTKQDLYNALILNGYHMPAFKAKITNTIYMKKVIIL